MIMLSSCVMETSCAVNFASQPASQSCPIESNECGCKAGKMWATVAATGTSGISNAVAAVDVMCDPLGRATRIAGGASRRGCCWFDVKK